MTFDGRLRRSLAGTHLVPAVLLVERLGPCGADGCANAGEPRATAGTPSPPELLAEGQPLPLVGRADRPAVNVFGKLQKSPVNKSANHLIVFDDERDFVCTHFEHRPSAGNVLVSVSEPGIEEACVVNPELTH